MAYPVNEDQLSHLEDVQNLFRVRRAPGHAVAKVRAGPTPELD